MTPLVPWARHWVLFFFHLLQHLDVRTQVAYQRLPSATSKVIVNPTKLTLKVEALVVDRMITTLPLESRRILRILPKRNTEIHVDRIR